jgi:hypothetical protein
VNIRNRNGMRALAGTLLLLAAASSAIAQEGGLSGGAYFESYRFGAAEATGINSISMMTLPVAANYLFGRYLDGEVRTAFARATMERTDGRQSEIAGLTDTELMLGVRIPGAVTVRVQGIVMLPTGIASQTPDQAEVAGAVAADLLPFRVSNWGSGGGVGLHTSLARSFGATGVGVSAAYLVGREFEPLEGEPFAYRPGNQLRLRAAVDHNVGTAGKVALTLLLENHSEDALDGANLYRPGQRFQAVGSYSFRAAARSAGIVYGGAMHRTQGAALLDWATPAPAQTLLLAGGGLRLPLGFGVLVPNADMRLFRSADGIGQGYITGLGLGTELRAAGLLVTPSVRGRIGNVLVREGSESGVTGFEVGVTARMRAGGRR